MEREGSMAQQAEDIFFNRTGLDKPRTQALLASALHGMDDGELYLEYTQSESLVWDDGRLKNANFSTAQGFGLRAVLGEAASYAHASTLDEAAILALINARAAAKQARDYLQADRIRAQLRQAGVELDDQAGGQTQWRRA